ncbi:MAG: alpha-1,4-glucan--maltose-1-phosphate maltosyltransferase [Thermaerobacter sp.]|nr:alpha-1,4-glucan--maltose-1-phosphate maltosyltransferase [Thermaerobacter sp.]
MDPSHPPFPARVVVTQLSPEVEAGRFPAKAVAGDPVVVRARVFADGHDVVGAHVLWQDAGGEARVLPMRSTGNDWFSATIPSGPVGLARYRVVGFVDALATWHAGAVKKLEAGVLDRIDCLQGAEYLEGARTRLPGGDRPLSEMARWWRTARPRPSAQLTNRLEQVAALADTLDAPADATVGPWREVWVDPPTAAFSAWYELFPRSTGEAGAPGTLVTLMRRLPYVRALGFDVLYLPPVHPIGRTGRKGPNNDPAPPPTADVPGSPWAIGAREGGHQAIHPDLGTLDDFDALVAAAASEGLAIALDLAFQCAPDHPWVAEHPEWFRHRPDGTIQYAENPPKTYQDIYPLDLAGEAYGALWEACRDVVRFWIGHGVRIFRVDNPHTKPFDFWEWLIRSLRAEHPDLVFLAEAFTRPAVMARLAQLGFSQSYTYFAWRHTGRDLRSYVEELQGWPEADFFRPNFWPNTPDILTEFLQTGGPAAFAVRAVLAATLSSNYGIYGPAFEEAMGEPLAPGREEYRDSEKYQVRHWAWDPSRGLGPLLTRLNQVRATHPALQRFGNVRFHATDNPELLAYSRQDPRGQDTLLVVVNLDPAWPQSGFATLDLSSLGMAAAGPFAVRDLLAGRTYQWNGAVNYVALSPAEQPAHVFEVVPTSPAPP